ncbi:peptidoglycan bridge formation glycyltransferase FemA/FemB family protein [Winogradskyella sp. DF17]|uniref:Peptidoglycan bridge formation glycyltransferase FemA/FemB family protein n=1 Tax=Winogradskyella pelagia TaxID=2819984 RepID=A0ABS3SZ45_9FLAO|nr:GNAT family N-acetyltransferase [Winogradskyella sp. DF17]MBO3115768.1 peptidoglycan bridge formation glycyltransferase FemA/FemB family protein [Winogradskyella sp. DF17]
MIELSASEDFFELQGQLDIVTSTQSKGWHSYKKSQGREIRYFVNDEAQPTIAVWGFMFKVPVLKKFLFVIEGMAHAQHLKANVITKFFSQLAQIDDFVGVDIDSNTVYNTSFEIGLRRAGFLRPLGSFNCPLTIEIDLQEPFRFDTNWKRNIKRTAGHNLIFEEKTHCSEADIKAIVDLYREMNNLKGRAVGHRDYQIKALVEEEDIRVFFVSSEDGEPLCARVIHCNDRFATDIFASNALKSRECGASYFIVQELLELLKAEGYETFDFGRIGPSTHSADSVYTFKKASRGREVQYLGEFSCYKNKLIELVLLVYKLKYKSPRY